MLQGPKTVTRKHIYIYIYIYIYIWGQDVAQAVEHSAVKVWILTVHNWSIKGCGVCCPVCGKVHIQDPLLLIGKSSQCSESRFPLKKYVTMTIHLTTNSQWYGNQCALEVSLNKTNFHHHHLCIIGASASSSPPSSSSSTSSSIP